MLNSHVAYRTNSFRVWIFSYDPRGKVENTYFVKEYDVGIDDVCFSVNNKTKTINGSFKIEKISNN